ncbi:MAG: ribonuclease PH [Candidatus Eisenbacteria bacterium]|nr:ribonuclease PH [Candidatus Eisenbacteria bacterium]
MSGRPDGRAADELRKITIKRNYLLYGEGSVLIETGNTRVICTATVEERVPPFRRESGGGWITAEYGMLPRSSNTRIRREVGSRGVKGRTHEIQRLIGRSIRSVVDLDNLGPRTILLDCDVIQADGGTRTAAINGAFLATVDALRLLRRQGVLGARPLRDSVAAVSVGVVGGEAVLDLDYEEDFAAEVDMNVVMTGSGRFVEVQGAAEGDPFSEATLQKMLGIAKIGVERITAIQREELGEEEV